MKRLLAVLAVAAACVALRAAIGSSGSSGIELKDARGTLSMRAVADDILQIQYVPIGVVAKPTDMLDPAGVRRAAAVGAATGLTLTTRAMRVSASETDIQIRSADGGTVVTIDRAALANAALKLTHASTEHLYGLRSYGLRDSTDARLQRANGLTRDAGAPVAASAQGDGGAPLAYSTHWGVLVDSIDGDATNTNGTFEFTHGSRKDVEAFVVIGPPKRTMAMVADLTGHSPLFPKWALGFMNSQWKTDEAEVRSIIATYREKQIPIDAFIMDFDFKAWGEDDFGEFRWNSTSGAGSVAPNKFPDGASGAFAKDMAARGIHLVGIMKPRVLVENTDHQPTKAAIDATAHNWWIPGKQPYQDYFSKRLANDFDFSKPDLRAWFWQHAKALFDTGIAGWWNDEADAGFDSLGHFHMAQALYDGQRGASNRRVWTLNRNFYLGAGRFAFGTWSGDINTGFGVMADQRGRLLTMIDLAQPHWSMDTGGFNGHPSPENYARWMEFAAVVPIMRVHNTFGEHRQPWVFGPVAEAAAKKAIEWRYALLPSIYSWEREATRTGIGIVRPLFWEFPDDPACANTTDAWMLGEALLVSPVVDQGQTTKSVYLPAGAWFDYWSDQGYDGGHAIDVPVDAVNWSDVPMFVRAGSILAAQPVMQFAGEKPVGEITLDIWSDAHRPARFEVYDDDGETYAYERGGFLSQVVTATEANSGVSVSFAKPTGTYRSAITTYRVRVHGARGATAAWNGRATTVRSSGTAVEMVIPAGQAGVLTVRPLVRAPR
jgi:alpha-glucosidase (family GH31 glycosyl hydrolase)